MTEIQVRYYFPSVGSTFAATAFENAIGTQVPIRIEGQRRGAGLLVGVEVVDDGHAALLTIDCSQPVYESIVTPDLPGGMSIGWRAL